MNCPAVPAVNFGFWKSAPGGIRTHGLSLRSFTDSGLFLSITDGFSGFESEKKKHYVDICRFKSARVEGLY